MARYSLFLGAVFGFLSVAFGAFAAHGLKEKLSDYHLGVFQTGVQYQFWHAIALVLTGLLYKQNIFSELNTVSTCFVVGICIFSGSLYALALTDIRILGAITPLGGVSFLLGWGLLGWSAWQGR